MGCNELVAKGRDVKKLEPLKLEPFIGFNLMLFR